jgi:DHA2 family multidrug resistance protein
VFINKWFDPRLILSFGFFLQGIAGVYMANFDINLSASGLAWANTLAGFGVGFVWVPLTLITFSTLDKKYLNEGNAFWHLTRNIGSSISISITVALIIRSTAMNYDELSHFISIFGDSSSIMSLKGAEVPNTTIQLTKLSSEINRQSRMIGYINAFHLYYWIAFAIIPVVMLVRLKPPAQNPKTQNS